MDFLPKPEVVRCYLDTEFDPPLSAMHLRWYPQMLGSAEQRWHLPGRLCLTGPAPERFGVLIRRQGPDSYAVKLLWDHVRFAWSGLGRVQLLTCALAPMLRALGTDLWELLNQPVPGDGAPLKKAG